MSESVYIAGVGMTPFTRHHDRSLEDLAAAAMQAAIQDAGCDMRAVGAVMYGGATQGALQGQHLIPGQTLLARAGVLGIPVFNIENACASGSSAFHLGVQLLRAGAHDIVLALGAEKMNIGDRERELAFFEAGWDIGRAEQNLQAFATLGSAMLIPVGSESPRPYSRFMGIYAAFGRAQMEKYGLTQRQIACVASKNHGHSVHNPLAQFRRPFTVDEVLAAPPIQYPLTLPMCAPISDGAAAVVLCTAAGLKRLTGNRSRAVRVLSSVVHGPAANPGYEHEHSTGRGAARQAFEQAGIGPEDISVAEVHDATAVGEVLALERLGLVPDGEAGVAAERGDLTVGGRLPVNTSGGLECKGHPIGATGLGQLHELVTQLRGEAGARQVAGARFAMQENGGGLVGFEEAAMAVTVLGRQ